MKYNFKAETPTAKLPTRHTKVSAGVDFYADESVYIPPGESGTVSTGISWNPVMEFDTGNIEKSNSEFVNCIFDLHFKQWFGLSLIIQSRSGMAFKQDIEASNAGVIDQDYVSTENKKAIIKVKLYNHGRDRFKVNHGDKICHGIPQLIPHFDDVETLDDNRNGLVGFGSSDGKEK